MKKKFITLLLCVAVGIGALSGCGGNTPAKELPEDSVAADITVDKESLPPLSEDLQEIYEGAYKIYYQISFGAFDTKSLIPVSRPMRISVLICYSISRNFS